MNLKPYTYILVQLSCVLLPFLFSFYPKIRFYKHWKNFFLVSTVVAVGFIGWDMLFTKIGVWSFNPKYVTGIYLCNLPLEEVLFFYCIPFCCVFTWHCFEIFFPPKEKNDIRINLLVWLASFVLIVTGILHIRQLYTSVTFILLGLTLAAVAWKMPKILLRFFQVYLIILIPFFISNGILTGSFTDEPVVIYNDAHNLGIRMFTIPFEDTFYGMLLLLLNYTGYSWLQKRK